MKPAKFAYTAPRTIDHALELLSEPGVNAKVLAGGQSLVPLLAMRLTEFDRLVDVNRIEAMHGVAVEGDWLRIGAGTRQAEIERHELVARHAPLLQRATRLIGHFQIRNRGTIGGSIAHADPSAEYPAVALVLDVQLEVHGAGGRRDIDVADFFESTWTTAMDDDELLVAIRVPLRRPRSGFAIDEVARRNGDFAMVGVACRVELDPAGTISSAAIGVFGVASTPVRIHGVEDALVGLRPGPELDTVVAGLGDHIDPRDDLHASGVYRRRLAPVLAARALATAIEEGASR
jgi:carbon-monoxide dehydrogenase medium subunit